MALIDQILINLKLCFFRQETTELAFVFNHIYSFPISYLFKRITYLVGSAFLVIGEVEKVRRMVLEKMRAKALEC